MPSRSNFLVPAVLVFLAVAAAPAASAGSTGGVLVVGDSLEVGTSPYLQSYLPGVKLTVDVEESRPSSAILDALSANIDTSQSVVVFDAGTNDDPAAPDTFAGYLNAAAEIAGPRCMVIATVNRPPYNGYTVDGINAAVAAFAASRPGTQVVDWRSAALTNPSLIYSDGVHPNSAGYQLRARLVAQAIQSCLVSAPSATRGVPSAAPPEQVTEPPPAPPSAEDRARDRAVTASLVGAEVINHARRLLDRQGAAGMLLLATALLWRD